MRRAFVFCFLLFATKSKAQNFVSINDKILIDSNTYKKWPIVSPGSGKISNDGNYMLYSTTYLERKSYTTVLKECKGKWEMKILDATNISFTSDSKMAIYALKDTLYLIELGSNNISRIPNVSYFQLLRSGNWISLFNNKINELTLRNLRTKEVRVYKSVGQFLFSEDGNHLLVEHKERKSEYVLTSLSIVDVPNDNSRIIWEGKSLMSMLFNKSGSKIVFMVSDSSDENRAIWFYKIGEQRGHMLVDKESAGFDSVYILGDLTEISPNGQYVFYTLKRMKKAAEIKHNKSTVKIWSYLDEELPSGRPNNGNFFSPSNLAVINTFENKNSIISCDREQILSKSNSGNVCLVEQSVGNGSELERNWNSASQKNYLVRILDSKVNHKLDFDGNSLIQLSPEGRFVVYYDKKRATYYSYQTDSGIYRNITAGIKVSWINYYRDDMLAWPRGICGWFQDDKYVLIYDRFDIWKVDPSGKQYPVNLTNGFGQAHNLIFDRGLEVSSSDIISSNDTLILNSINLDNKQNGYYQLAMNGMGNLKRLIMSDAIYHLVDNPYVDTRGSYPIRAMNRSKFILIRMKANESPNYFYTEDFKSFIPQSQLYPERRFNWYYTELINWNTDSGEKLQGVLYKPENFDSTRKYPIIFYYYEKKSFSLNEFLFPNSISNDCNINIPTFVSNGYLVFTPDINYVIGDPMQGAYNAIVSAAKHLSLLSFVDSTKMGIGSCSFGGIETNYLVTHTNLFAAAYSSSAMVDLISAYGDLTRQGNGLHHAFEWGQLRMGGTLWQKTDLYIKNSAIFHADKISTPLLIMHTTDDAVCSFAQAVEFFTALRRLGKKAWMLEYPNSNHGVTGAFAQDFSIRLGQFFNHYLKGQPAPLWMTNGAKVDNMGVDGDYQLDGRIETPGKGLLKNAIDSVKVE